MTVDDTLEILSSCFQDKDFLIFSDLSEKLKIVHKCLDGFGMDYDQEKITSVKAYCKILDHYPKISDEFNNLFLSNESFKREFHNLCSKKSPCLLDRSSGLSGINIAVKKDLITNKLTKSCYIKTWPYRCTVVNCCGDELTKTKYYYIKNSFLKSIMNKVFKLKMASTLIVFR